jgi:hypothetical protein
LFTTSKALAHGRDGVGQGAAGMGHGDDAAHLARLPQVAQQRQGRHAGQAQVHQHQVHAVALAHRFQRLVPVGGVQHLAAGPGQVELQELADARIGIDHQDARLAGQLLAQLLAGRAVGTRGWLRVHGG